MPHRQPLYPLLGAMGVMLLVSCASPIEQRPTQLQEADNGVQRYIVVTATTEVKPANGYARIIKAGSRWKYSGSVPEGDVYRIQNDVFMVEGANMHEAYSVIDGEHLVGFYLPVKQTFAPLPKAVRLAMRKQ